MDALDGHQARKVQDTPLEDAFDHGADSVSLVYLTMATCCALQLGTNPFCMLVFCMTASAVFYVLHWKLYATGVFKYLWPFFEVELQIIGSLIFLISAGLGPAVWSTQVPFLCATIKVVLVYTFVVGCAVECAPEVREILARWLQHAGKTVQATDVVAPLAILSAITATTVLVPSLDTALFLHQPCVFVLVLGTVTAKGNARIMGAYNTFSNAPYRSRGAYNTFSDAPYLDSCLLVPGIIFVISCLNVTSGLHDGTAQGNSRLLVASLMMLN
ncbi:choline/ethanolaminephosphotransferase 1-like [Branchiostoma floridae]|uniref:Choline/ethanolaminephosphotransferase 1-like n=1 Tax=Branchiostoma floridae TaxID=7739 RepID=A0A9J7LHR0_BRAFL|nr:choline/ethanolaminephosphotransferase 1-like [Branchiostoma floridae]